MSTVTKKKPEAQPPVVVRFPAQVVKKLDRAAQRNGRSRSSEVRVRILESLASEGRP